jgi:hypothetical protein
MKLDPEEINQERKVNGSVLQNSEIGKYGLHTFK